MVQVRSGASKPKLVNMGMAPVPRDAFAEGRIAKPEIIANIIQQLSSHLKIKQKSVAISVSGYDVMIKKIEVPTMTEQDLEAKMYSELGQYIPYNVDEVDIDYQVMDIAKDRPNFMEVLLVAAKKESIADLNGLLKLVGLDAYVVDVDFFALGNAFEAAYGFEEDSIALLDMGANKSVMNISHKGVPIFTRGVSIGGNQITESIKDYFRVSFEEAESAKLGETPETYQAQALEDIFVSTAGSWINECKRALDFYYHNYPDNTVKSLYLSGGSCRLPGFDKVLQEHLDIPVEVFNPITKLQYDSKQFDPAYLEYIGPQMAISLGLALRKTKEK
jgi:type IV pilus assembly protein PilM